MYILLHSAAVGVWNIILWHWVLFHLKPLSTFLSENPYLCNGGSISFFTEIKLVANIQQYATQEEEEDTYLNVCVDVYKTNIIRM